MVKKRFDSCAAAGYTCLIFVTAGQNFPERVQSYSAEVKGSKQISHLVSLLSI